MVGIAGTAVAQGGETVEMITDGDTYFFDPIGLSVEPGTTITFENVSGTHNAVSYADRIPSDAREWDTPLGETAEHAFEVPGTYDYYCAPHKTLGMVGRIVVGDPGGPAEGTMPLDGDVPDSETIVQQGAVSFDEFASVAAAGGDLLRGAGLFGGVTIAAAVVYWLANSEGERYRVGSSEWKRKEGVR